MIESQLMKKFEDDFGIPLPEKRKDVNESLSRINTLLFESYVHPHAKKLTTLISASIASPSWPPTSRPTIVSSYVYTGVLHLVSLHTELTTTAEQLTVRVLSSLFETICKALLDAFRARATSAQTVAAWQQPNGTSNNAGSGHHRFSLPDLMQATLDVEFFAQTLGALYGTEKASEYQSQVYVELDRAGDARALQAELPEMRGILKKLKESTRGEFACFKREKRERTPAGGREGADSRAR